MADGALPLLLLPRPTQAARNKQGGGVSKFHKPSVARQAERVAPRFEVLQQAFEAKRLRLQQAAPNENPELVVVFETIGSIEDFSNAVSKISGLEWFFEWDEDDIEPDEDFFDEDDKEKRLSGRLFLVGTNQEALDQIISLWKRFSADPLMKFPHGHAPWRHVFKQLKDVRYWSVADRLTRDVREYWESEIAGQQAVIRFEIEIWHFQSQQKNQTAYDEIRQLLQAAGGQALQRAILPDIEYHGVLAELPPDVIQQILDGVIPELVLSDRIMFFRPRAQALRTLREDAPPAAIEIPAMAPTGEPIVALLDGFPQQNHPLIGAWLRVDDPDGWEAIYEVKDRVHGTAMASLIIHGELDAGGSPISRPIYVRPILQPNLLDVFGPRRSERTPDNVLLIDLLHRAVKRIFEGEGDLPPAAPDVRIINLSIGNEFQVFDRNISPLARLLDWLAAKYSVLFVVSAGNVYPSFTLAVRGNSFTSIARQQQQTLCLKQLLSGPASRRLISPSEAINVVTVGASHSDASVPPAVPDRFDPFDLDGISPISRIGYGFRRAVKPDILMPGGRTLFLERPVGNPLETVLEVVNSTREPGQRVAIPPLPGGPANATVHSRGTSNATALASRHAARLYDVIVSLREASPAELPNEYDGVLLKAMLAHGADWGDNYAPVFALRSELGTATEKQEFLGRWIGYGPVNAERAIACTETRATMLGVGKVSAGEALLFSAPLPPSLAGKKVWRRLVVTLAWFSPINAAHRNYRRARLWITPPDEELRIGRNMTVFHKAAQRGTLQHEALEGEQAAVFADGDRLEFKVNCSEDAGGLTAPVRFALCVSLEVPIDTGIPVYQEIRQRIAAPVAIQP